MPPGDGGSARTNVPLPDPSLVGSGPPGTGGHWMTSNPPARSGATMADAVHRSLPLSLWRAGVLGRCPACGRTSMFSGYASMHERCAECDLRYQTSSGAWLGALAIGYGIGALMGMGLAFVELTWRPIRDVGWEPMWVIAAASLLATVAGYRWAKGIWFALLYRWDFMAFGDVPPGPTGAGPTLPREP